MRSATFDFQTVNTLTFFVRKITPEFGQTIKGIVLIAHGLSEHSGRYVRFAEALVKAGFGVYVHDQRGHGKTAKRTDAVTLSKGDFEGMVDDVAKLRDMAEECSQGVPIFLFGHSLGTVIVRKYIEKFGGRSVRGVVLSGPLRLEQNEVDAFAQLVDERLLKTGREAVDAELNAAFFGHFNDAFMPARTSFEWLSRDHAEVDRYEHDLLCGQPQTIGFYEEFIAGYDTEHRDRISRINSGLPILLLSGDCDPVSANGQSAFRIAADCRAAGIANVDVKIYNGARHELLNETNRSQVTDDIVAWLEKQL
ncbi:MAG: alpha/beta hydrolase [Sporolactobacillus sp.]